jgi:hypothetical protein
MIGFDCFFVPSGYNSVFLKGWIMSWTIARPPSKQTDNRIKKVATAAFLVNYGNPDPE